MSMLVVSGGINWMWYYHVTANEVTMSGRVHYLHDAEHVKRLNDAAGADVLQTLTRADLERPYWADACKDAKPHSPVRRAYLAKRRDNAQTFFFYDYE